MSVLERLQEAAAAHHDVLVSMALTGSLYELLDAAIARITVLEAHQRAYPYPEDMGR